MSPHQTTTFQTLRPGNIIIEHAGFSSRGWGNGHSSMKYRQVFTGHVRYSNFVDCGIIAGRYGDNDYHKYKLLHFANGRVDAAQLDTLQSKKYHAFEPPTYIKDYIQLLLNDVNTLRDIVNGKFQDTMLPVKQKGDTTATQFVAMILKKATKMYFGKKQEEALLGKKGLAWKWTADQMGIAPPMAQIDISKTSTPARLIELLKKQRDYKEYTSD